MEPPFKPLYPRRGKSLTPMSTSSRKEMRRRRRSSQSTRRTQRAFKQCEAADGEKLVAPAVARVACIASSEVWELYRRSTATADIPPVFAPVDRSEQFEEAFATILREHADALVTEGSPIIYVQRGRIVTFAAEHRLALAANNRESVEEGGLMSYGIKASGLFSDLAI